MAARSKSRRGTDMVRTASSPEELAARVNSAPAATAIEHRELTNYDLVAKQHGAIEKALTGTPVSVERFVRAVQTQLRRPETHLAECTPASLLGAVVTLAQLGLEPGPLGLSYIEARRNGKTGRYEAQPGIEYRGFVELAGRSGRMLSIGAYDVHENDDFSFDQATNEVSHTWDLRQPRGAIYAHYGVANLKGGGKVLLVMSCVEADEFRQYSEMGRRNKGPWVTHPHRMHSKTVILRMEPWLPKSSELMLAFASDSKVVAADTTTAETETPLYDYDVEIVEDEAPDEEPVADAEVVEG